MLRGAKKRDAAEWAGTCATHCIAISSVSEEILVP